MIETTLLAVLTGALSNLTSDAIKGIIGKLASKHPEVEQEPRQPGGCKLKTAPVRPVVAARPAEYVCSEDLFY
ncbi:TPA: hypothetical protein KL366_005149 [Escherichia coli]|nr:hypothetical protein [Escherichia coli]HBE2554367.1 hypothetical protein [Escherichia coli]